MHHEDIVWSLVVSVYGCLPSPVGDMLVTAVSMRGHVVPHLLFVSADGASLPSDQLQTAILNQTPNQTFSPHSMSKIFYLVDGSSNS